MPPEAKDVPQLMQGLVHWIEETKNSWTPAPIVAGLAHCQFVTIHPYYDGNGRTARLLSNFILQRAGYGMRGCLAVEERHYRDLPRYYKQLVTHPRHNYYGGGETADLTAWVDYHVEMVHEAAMAADRESAGADGKKGKPKIPRQARSPDPRARKIFAALGGGATITANGVAAELGLSARMARELLSRWVQDGWLAVADASRRKRAYALAKTRKPSAL
jgi:Fic family protein